MSNKPLKHQMMHRGLDRSFFYGYRHYQLLYSFNPYVVKFNRKRHIVNQFKRAGHFCIDYYRKFDIETW